MNNSLDPVDRAFDALKTERWKSETTSLELENRLMQERMSAGKLSRLTKYRAVMVAGAALLIGGAGFAATDTGSSAIKRLLVLVNIEGEESELTLELIEGGEASWTMENQDGGETTIHLTHSPSTEGVVDADMVGFGEGNMMAVDVEIVGDSTGDKDIAISLGGEPADGTVVIDTTGDSAMLDELSAQSRNTKICTKDLTFDADGKTLRIVKESVGDGDSDGRVEVIELKGDAAADHQERRAQVHAFLKDEADGATNVEVEVGEDGIATIYLTYPDGSEVVRKIELNDSQDVEFPIMTDEDDIGTAKKVLIER